MAYPMPDVIVVLPGIGGSALAKDGKDVWAMSAGAAMRALLSLGRSIKDLTLADDPADADDLGDGITAPRLLPDLHLIPGLWKIDGYGKILKAIESTFQARRGENLFEFPYDWRRDNRVAARRLARQSAEWLKSWRERSGNDGARLILVGHSMGGLVARYFLEALDGWKDTRMLVTFGTPYGGSVNAVDFLSHGFLKKLGPVRFDLSEMLRSFTSVYHLLPVFRCVDAGGPDLVHLTETELPNLDPTKVKAAAGFHAEIADQVTAHLDDAGYRESGYDIRPVVGEGQPTLQSVRFADGEVEVLRSRKGDDEGGDGTVPKLSSFPKELLEEQRNVMFASERHASLQNFDPVLVQLTGLLRGLPADVGTYYALNTKLSLDLDDLFVTGEPVPVAARPEAPGVELVASVVDAATNAVVQRVPLVEGDEGWHRAEVPPLAAGDYRLTVRGEIGVDPVTDVFTVVDPAAVEG